MTTTSKGGAISPAPIQLTGSALILREWDEADVPAMVELFDDPAVDRWTPLRAPFDQAAARAYLDLARQRRAQGHRLQLAITTDGRQPLGEILLFPTGAPGEVELAYAVGAAHRGQGLASRAVQLITAYAYDSLAATHVILRISAGNTPSAAVAHDACFHLTPAPPISRAGARDPLHTWLHGRSEQPITERSR
ncbi:GNAT family N-acetyltransferase [Kribbella catacumbae]|uniref:GNAT family N-acetyltransferase n=1 Tax=Kribbella catacumbae TaxID=460086 RepID=UPI000379D00D|nr:GNAT family N-acetyltransferase [Kribbella catacumbae]